MPRALDSSKAGVQILEQLTASNPTNATLREFLGQGYDAVSALLEKQGDLVQALTYARKSRQVFVELRAGDATDRLARVNIALADLSVARLLLKLGRTRDSLSSLHRVIAVFAGIESKNRYEIAGQRKLNRRWAEPIFRLRQAIAQKTGKPNICWRHAPGWRRASRPCGAAAVRPPRRIRLPKARSPRNWPSARPLWQISLPTRNSSRPARRVSPRFLVISGRPSSCDYQCPDDAALARRAAGNAPIPMVTLAATLDRSKNNVQQVTLVFEVKDPSIKSCAQPKP
jgi:hypothetical protein